MPIVTLSKQDQTLSGEFYLLLEYGNFARVEWRVGGRRHIVLPCFRHIQNKSVTLHNSLITAKHWELEHPVMSLLGYFRETLYFKRHTNKLIILKVRVILLQKYEFCLVFL